MARLPINSSAVHVFEVLRLVARTDEPLGVSEISRRLGLPASTVYRALITLEASDYLARHQNMPRYEIGQMPQLLNRALVHRFRLHAASRPHLRKLAERTGETASLTVRLGWYALRLAGIYGSHDIYHRDRLGEVSALHQSVTGIAILAFLPGDAIEAYCAFAEREGIAMDRIATRKRLNAAQDAGIARSPELASVALPVRKPTGGVLAAIAITGSDPAAAVPPMALYEVRDALEAEINAAAAQFDSPFAHIPADEIVIALDRAAS